jgi:hypothetical protein
MRKAGLQLVRQSARSLRCASQPTKSNGQTFGPIPSPGTTVQTSRQSFSNLGARGIESHPRSGHLQQKALELAVLKKVWLPS